MTVLSNEDVERSIEEGGIHVKRPETDEVSLEPASMDVHLGREIKYPSTKNGEAVVVDDPTTYPSYGKVESDRPLIRAGGFGLATTEEHVTVPNDKVALLHGRSSVGRLGLFIENAGLIDPGFSGEITLELTNVVDYDIELKAGMRIGQLTFHDVENAPDVGYSEENGNKYNGQRGPTPSRLHEDF
jgi:dCTP deaminase